MATLNYTAPFVRRLKALGKRYRNVRSDIEPILEQLQQGLICGDQIRGLELSIFKVRAKNTDIPTGKSGGYRIIYQVISPETIVLLLIYAKSDQADVTAQEIKDALQKVINPSF